MKKYYFTCCHVINGSLKAETIFTENRDNAYNSFKEKWGEAPFFLDGPFYRKLEKNKKPIHNKEIKLGTKIIKGKVKDCHIKGIALLDPENYIFVTFCDDKDLNKKIIHISEVKDIS